MTKPQTTARSPVIAVMGHIDHGKSTLLDYIRKSNVADEEAGGITQHISAYEITHKNDSGETRMTFLDTPGHEAFISMRYRGAKVADIVVLVVAADDGVQEQTKETIEAIQNEGVPFVVAINKIDVSVANPETVIQELAEEEVYVEGYGGDISYVEISAKTGENVGELLDLLALNAEILELTTNPEAPASGDVIESSVDPKRGTQATLIITDGKLVSGAYVQAGESVSPVRILENFRGESINEALASTPVRVVGFNKKPQVGVKFKAFKSKAEAQAEAKKYTENTGAQTEATIQEDIFTIPIVVKTDVSGTANAIAHELKKLHSDRAQLNVIQTGVGDITEDDIRAAASDEKSALVVGFNVSATPSAQAVADRRNVAIRTANVIYDLSDWLKEATAERTPTITVKEVRGKARILKIFSRKRDTQVVGGKVFEGKLLNSAGVTVIRNETELAEGKIIELQQQRADTDKVESGQEFGANIQSEVKLAPGDVIEAFELVEK